MKKLCAICLSLLLLWQIALHVTVFACWQLNREVIAATLCEKKDLKGNTCKGNCFLKKQIQKASENSQAGNAAKPEHKTETLDFTVISSPPVYAEIQFVTKPVFPAYHQHSYSNQLDLSVFQPPEILV